MTTPPGQLRLTRDGLRELGACAPYLRAFADAFPADRHPRGVEVTEETCAAHSHLFDWGWAAGVFLTHVGRAEYERLVQSRAQANRRFGTGTVRRAAVVGHLFATRPELRSRAAVDAMTGGEERADARLLRDVEHARAALADAVRERDSWARRVPEREERLATLEALAVGAARRGAARAAERAAAEVKTAEATLARLRATAEAAAAALEALPPEPVTADEPATAAPAAEVA